MIQYRDKEVERGMGEGRMRIPNKQISKEAKQSNTKHNEDSNKTEQSSKAKRSEEKQNETNKTADQPRHHISTSQ